VLKDPNTPLPDETVDTDRTITLGGTTLELSYVGPNHSDSTLVRSLDAWREPEGATALSTLIRQRHLTPSCGGHAPTAERTVGPARIVMESFTPKPGIREQHRPRTGHKPNRNPAMQRSLGSNCNGISSF
jgi:hypothetical protein